MKKNKDMKEGKMKFALILFIALMTVTLAKGETHADDLLEKINSLISFLSKQSIQNPVGSRYARSKYYPIIRKAARQYMLDPFLIESIIEIESNFNPGAVSKKGAMGLMQLMPETAREIGVSKPFDPYQNIMGGSYYYRLMLERFGNHRKALYAYNCGPECVNNGRIPRESKRYANNVIHEYKKLKRKEKKNVK